MVSAANSGLFNTISANQGKLNSRKSKDFLWGGIPRRFSNKKVELKTRHLSGEQRQKFINRLKEAQAMDKQKEWYTLTISILLTLLLAVAFF